MAKDTPLQTVKRIYETKAKLVDSLLDFAKLGDEDKGDTKDRLAALTNAKLLRLANRAKAVADFGGRDKLVAAISAAAGKVKDSDYVAKLGTFTTGRLLDMATVAKRKTA